jgi:hypothetical protein
MDRYSTLSSPNIKNLVSSFKHGNFGRVEGWTTMACHVYDPIYFRMMTIAMFDMQVKDVEFQVIMWGAF